jgi:hypothetical protein
LKNNASFGGQGLHFFEIEWFFLKKDRLSAGDGAKGGNASDLRVVDLEDHLSLLVGGQSLLLP